MSDCVSDGGCFTVDDRTISSPTEAREAREGKEEEKEEETGDGEHQANVVETPEIRNSQVEDGGQSSSWRKTCRRKMLSESQVLVLNGVYKSKPYLTPEESKNLASNLNLSREKVQSWFTQRRYNQRGAQSDGLHHCALCDKTYKSRSGSKAHMQKHLMEFPTPMRTQPFFTFDPSINDKI